MLSATIIASCMSSGGGPTGRRLSGGSGPVTQRIAPRTAKTSTVATSATAIAVSALHDTKTSKQAAGDAGKQDASHELERTTR